MRTLIVISPPQQNWYFNFPDTISTEIEKQEDYEKTVLGDNTLKQAILDRKMFLAAGDVLLLH